MCLALVDNLIVTSLHNLEVLGRLRYELFNAVVQDGVLLLQLFIVRSQCLPLRVEKVLVNRHLLNSNMGTFELLRPLVQ